MRRALVLSAALFALVVVLFVAALFWQARLPAAQDVPPVDILAFFDGTSVSAGTIRTALVRGERFTADFRGTRDGGTLRLDERFHFSDGERLQVWHLTAAPDGAVSGTVETERSDGTLAAPVPVVGQTGQHGTTLRYRGNAPGGGIELEFQHTMRAADSGTVSNHVVISLFGLPIATSTVRFAKDAAVLSTIATDR